MYAMPADQQRIDALRKGITAANDGGYVTIRVADLRWLLDTVENRSTNAPTVSRFGGEIDDRDDE